MNWTDGRPGCPALQSGLGTRLAGTGSNHGTSPQAGRLSESVRAVGGICCVILADTRRAALRDGEQGDTSRL